MSAAEGASSKTDRNTLTLLGARGARPVPWAGQRVPSAGEVGGVVPAGLDRLYLIGTGLRTDGTRVIAMVIKSR